MIQNAIFFTNYSEPSIFKGDAETSFAINFLTDDDLMLTSTSPELCALNLIAKIISDRIKNGPKVNESILGTLQITFFDPCNSIELYKSRELEEKDYYEGLEISVFLESVFGKVEFQLKYECKNWTVIDVLEKDIDFN
jgi:hypothetical protein